MVGRRFDVQPAMHMAVEPALPPLPTSIAWTAVSAYAAGTRQWGEPAASSPAGDSCAAGPDTAVAGPGALHIGCFVAGGVRILCLQEWGSSEQHTAVAKGVSALLCVACPLHGASCTAHEPDVSYVHTRCCWCLVCGCSVLAVCLLPAYT